MNLRDLEKWPTDELWDWIEGIPDAQAEDSEYDGDSDADDAVNYSVSSKNSTSRASGNVASPSHLSNSTSSKSDDLEAPGPSNLGTNLGRAIRGAKRSYIPDEAVEDFDSDDSTADPDYIDDVVPPSRIQQILIAGGDSTDDEESAKEDDLTTDNTKTSFQFSKVSSAPQMYSNYIFSQNSGSTFNVDDESPLDIFESVITTQFLEHIVKESNKYASQRGINLELGLYELKAFLGMLIIMGFHSLPSLRLYWSTEANMKVDRIAAIMPLKRFLLILRNLHLNDNAKMPTREDVNFDKLYKLRPMIDTLNENFKKLYIPDRNLAVDESMVGFKGRTSLKQYMPMKPTKRGFKIWAIACSKTSYLLGFDVYQGKSKEEEVGTLGERVVLKLSKPYWDKGYCVFFDNFFSSFELLRTLLAKNTFACGTFRKDRKHYPKQLLVVDKSLQMGEFDFAMSSDISVVKWKDRGKKPVIVISSMENPSDTTFVQRTDKTGVKENVKCPVPIYTYNRFMGGVDQFDQLHTYYSISWKSRRWWLKLFYFFLDAVIVNSYILYKTERKKKNLKPLCQLKFRNLLATQLIGNFCSRKRKGPPPSAYKTLKKATGRSITVDNPNRLSDVGKHVPIKGTSRRCASCSTKEKSVRSQMICKACNVALCLTCFAPFHNV